MANANLAVLKPERRIVGRYAIHEVIARGGMATIHVGTLVGPVGFSRTVAIKRLHEGFAQDPDFVAMLLDEARLAGRIVHPNVVATIDVVTESGEVFLVMDYVSGESVANLVRILEAKGELIPLRILSAIVSGALSGLHAAHEARDERGVPLQIVHRDMSPHNILLGADGVPRVIDFGVAKAAARIQVTQDGQIKGKLRYMAPEQVTGAELTRSIDIFAIGVVLWELVTGVRLREGESTAQIAMSILDGAIPSPKDVRVTQGQTLDAAEENLLAELEKIIVRATAMDPENRYATAKDMARDLSDRVPTASSAEVADWIESIAGSELRARAEVVAMIECESANATGGARPSQVMRALVASRPEPIEVAIAGGTGSGAVVRPSRLPRPEVVAEKAPATNQPTSGQKTLVLVAIFLSLASFFLWLALAEKTPATLAKNDAAALLVLPSASAPAPSASSSAPRADEPDAAESSGADASGAPSVGPKVFPVVPCQPFTYDEQGVKRYNPKCVR